LTEFSAAVFSVAQKFADDVDLPCFDSHTEYFTAEMQIPRPKVVRDGSPPPLLRSFQDGGADAEWL
jgi:hypothetical protein